MSEKKDHWSAKAYTSAAGFVPKLATKVVQYLNSQPGDHILDLGCGDGILTAQIADTVTSSGRVLGLDASESFISTAQEQYTRPNCTFRHVDCTRLEGCADAVNGSWDKVFSNAAMHWILRNPETRVPYFHNVHRALKPGGLFAFEMGGQGNVSEVHAAAMSALIHAGLSVQQAREASPWFFPSTEWVRATLTEAGFDVEICELEYRPTKLLPEKSDGSAGVEGFVKLMGAQFLDAVSPEQREGVLREICTVIDPIVTRQEDGSKWLGYCRLRAVARKR